MLTDRDLLPLHERKAARAAIERLVQQHGSQAAAGDRIGVSQNAVNKAVLHTKIGPSVMRLLLAHLGLDPPELLRRYGDPAAGPPAAPASRTMTPREEAIVTAVHYAPAGSERDVRAIADEYDAILEHAEPIEWLETLVREIQRRIPIPKRHQRGETGEKLSERRAPRRKGPTR